MTMNSLDVEILHYLSLLGLEEKKAVLLQMKTMLKVDENENTTITREEYLIRYNKELDDAMADIAAGNFITQEDLEKESENWQYED